MAWVFQLDSDNNLVCDLPNREKIITPITAENKNHILEQYGANMNIETYYRVKEVGQCQHCVEWKIDKLTRMLAHLKTRVDAGLPPAPTWEWWD